MLPSPKTGQAVGGMNGSGGDNGEETPRLGQGGGPSIPWGEKRGNPCV